MPAAKYKVNYLRIEIFQFFLNFLAARILQQINYIYFTGRY